MPACIKCLNEEVKNILMSITSNKEIRNIPICEDNSEIKFDDSDKKKKRKPSAYNQFVSSCIKEDKGKGIKDCAKLWKSQKGK